MNNTTKVRFSPVFNRRRGTIRINRAGGLKPNWLRLVAALMIVAAAAITFSQNAYANLDSLQVIQFLNQTIDWYRHATPVQQTATEPEDFNLVSASHANW